MMALRLHQFLQIVFANNLNAFRFFKLAMPNYSSKAIQLEFDPNKESRHVVSHYSFEGLNF